MNNYRAMIFHIIISVLACITYGITDKFQNKTLSIINFIFILIFYLLSGSMLKGLGSAVENLKSVSLIFIFGVILWTISIILIGFGPIRINNNWTLYGFYTFYFLPILNIFRISNPLIYLIASLIPSLLLWLGLELKEIIVIKNH